MSLREDPDESRRLAAWLTADRRHADAPRRWADWNAAPKIRRAWTPAQKRWAALYVLLGLVILICAAWAARGMESLALIFLLPTLVNVAVFLSGVRGTHQLAGVTDETGLVESGRGWTVRTILRYGRRTVVDAGVLWVEDGLLCFSGERTSFAIPLADARRSGWMGYRFPTPTGWAELAFQSRHVDLVRRVHQAWADSVPTGRLEPLLPPAAPPDGK
jgi:hypothetical protein